jgi:hypothetical protein
MKTFEKLWKKIKITKKGFVNFAQRPEITNKNKYLRRSL